jgi:hypothetical protein
MGLYSYGIPDTTLPSVITHTVTQDYARHDRAKAHVTIIIWAHSLKGEHH